jgi:acetylornithine deacetylase/succinyl-diaminopimelate desuccinylase-like protein
MSACLTDEMVQYIQQRCTDPALRQEMVNLLVRITKIDTTPDADVTVMAANEQAVFDILAGAIGSCGVAGVEQAYHEINPAIADHPYFTPVHYTKTPDRPEGLGPAQAYAGRHNLIVRVPGACPEAPGVSLAMNAHIDVVAPYFPPRVDDVHVHGRGSADDKGGVMAMVGALKLLGELQAKFGLKLAHDLTVMIVIEEEPGGNGSLSLALDEDLKQQYDAMLVFEITGLKLHPANRGALWYACELKNDADPAVDLFEASAFVTLEMEKEGAQIKAESEHALFPDRPVQTCHGMLGQFGAHPSAVNDHVEFDLIFEQAVADEAAAAVTAVLDQALADYIARYGDKQQEPDPETGEPKVPVHYETRVDGQTLRVIVHGKAGHMGAILECDCGITKNAYFLRALMAERGSLAAKGSVRFRLVGHADPSRLVQEGGQGFVPTHDLAQVGRRMSEAVGRGVEAYGQAVGKTLDGAQFFEMTYDKLHNDAFDGDPNSPTMQVAIDVQKRLGIWDGEPILGWKVSCDARLFAKQYPGMPVVTFGPGLLKDAHSDTERVKIDELMQSIAFATLAAAEHCGCTTD